MGCSPPSLLSPPQMPDYKHATLQEDEGPEPAGDGSASPDSVEVSYAPVPLFCLGPLSCSPSLQQEWGQEPGQPWLSLDDVLGGSQNAAKSVPLPCSSRGGCTSIHKWLIRKGCTGFSVAVSKLNPHLVPMPHSQARAPGSSLGSRCDFSPCLLPRWGSGRGRGRC